MARGFDRFMVHVGIGPNRKMRRLSDGEFRAFVAGILPIAAESPVRGHLLIAEGVPAGASDVAEQAGVPEKVAASTLEKLTQYGTLTDDPSYGCSRVAQWHVFNPPPRPSETREAWRTRKRAERERQRRDQDRAEQEGRAPQLRMSGTRSAPLRPVDGLPAVPAGNRTRDRDRYLTDVSRLAERLYPDTDRKQAVAAIDQALRMGASTEQQVREFVTRWWPDVRAA